MMTPDLTEARRLFDLGLQMCQLEPCSKQPAGGKGWNKRPITHFDDKATGYGVMLADNGLCSVDPDNAVLANKMLAGLGFNLASIMAAGVQSVSTRPSSGGRSAFRAAPGLRWVKFSFKDAGTVLELRAASPNLQDVIPGLIYKDKSGVVRTQQYTNGKRLDDAPELPADLLEWWRRMSEDVEFQREQQRLAGEILGITPHLAISAGDGKSLAFKSSKISRPEFNLAHDVREILLRHGYVESDDGERYAPPTATGKPGIREIPGKDGLMQSDHASDPLWGTFDAWSAFVVLDHDGDLHAAEEAALAERHAAEAAAFDEDISDILGEPPIEPTPPTPKFQLIDAADFADGPAPEWIVRDVLPQAEVACVYGESGSGKSFFILDLVASIALGSVWNGHKVKQGRVVYIAAEGAGGFRKRVKAYQLANEVSLRGVLSVLPAAPNLLTDDDKEVAKAIKAGGGAAVVVIDTLAQATPGGNENSGEDMGRVIARCKRLHVATGAMVILVHHAGKDTTKGARGWSGIRAAMDAEIEVTRVADARCATLRKQKDGDDGGAFNFKLRQVLVDTDDEGEDVTSCVVEYVEGPPPMTKASKLGGNQRIVFDTANEIIGLAGEITVGELLTACVEKMPHDSQKRDKRREHAKRALDSLISGGRLQFAGGRVMLPHAPTCPI